MAILSLSPARSIAAGLPRFVSVPTLSAAAVQLISEPVPVVQQPEQIYALPGTLGAAEFQSYTVYLKANNGQTYGLYGETPDVERQIADLHGRGPDLLVKVWGTLYPVGRQSGGPEIVVSAIEASVQEGDNGAPPPS